MNKIETNLNADIIPSVSGGGIRLDITLNYFLENTHHQFFKMGNFDKSLVLNNEWLIIEYNVLDVYGVAQTTYSATWNGNEDVFIKFNCKDNATLEFMLLQGNYQGKLLGKWGIGATLKELSQEYDIEFYAAAHYLKEKNFDKDEVIPVEIHTDYLVSFERQSNQTVRAMCLYK